MSLPLVMAHQNARSHRAVGARNGRLSSDPTNDYRRALQDRNTDYRRSSLRPAEVNDTRNPGEVIYSLGLVVIGVAYASYPKRFLFVLAFWMWLCVGVLWICVSTARKWRARKADAAHRAMRAERGRELVRRAQAAMVRGDGGGGDADEDARRRWQRPSFSLQNSPSIAIQQPTSSPSGSGSTNDSSNESHDFPPASPRLPGPGVSPRPASALQAVYFGHLAGADPQCSICLGTFNGVDRVHRLFCSHVYHEGCLNRWGTRSSRSPFALGLCIGWPKGLFAELANSLVE